jgi:hypothetical protein
MQSPFNQQSSALEQVAPPFVAAAATNSRKKHGKFISKRD